jgi:phage-related minor tail protein
MEDAIVNFAKTGKFEFKSFLNSVLEEILRSQIRQLLAQTFNIGGSRGGGGSILGSIGKLLGFANGGIIPTNNPVIVGERGPELISGAAGRNVTPNSSLGLGTTNVTYNISAVDARSFKEMIAADPSFMFAVTEQGRRALPASRR